MHFEKESENIFLYVLKKKCDFLKDIDFLNLFEKIFYVFVFRVRERERESEGEK